VLCRLHVPWLAGATLQLEQQQLQQLQPRHLAELLIAMAHFRLLPPPAWLLAYQRAAGLQLPAYSASDLAVSLAAASQLKLRAMELVLTSAWLLALIREVQARVGGPAAAALRCSVAVRLYGVWSTDSCALVELW
jgi:hypothetical protein